MTIATHVCDAVINACRSVDLVPLSLPAMHALQGDAEIAFHSDGAVAVLICEPQISMWFENKGICVDFFSQLANGAPKSAVAAPPPWVPAPAKPGNTK